MQATANEDAIPNETLLKIELLGNLIKTYKKNKREKQLKQIELEALISTDLQQQLQSQQNSTFIRVSSSSITKKRLLKNSN
ncbi:hypothetical protein TTHERM_00177920 (macronuclear) [Tetrahymena thermophila SB210]|uniref:Uncharacterized protein n=1 Tax=Tetrahymena thermophila (strain SB210) TaxID=312017 RepID=Q22TC7_TETTS|nr:hypothetical protein TTHERM_00177920 [Tetrahymena thermophila SB210]EAR88511.3 hypothetical protein TTHERM_00177920 [Tetrahymena thermophila SB210]|eukprot:XP_001008756.3 hypothetical protein TTHERM_00177920 [Tetrahymena thermophila SB210]